VLGVSERRSCQLLRVARSGLHRLPRQGPRRRAGDPPWVERLRGLIQQFQTFEEARRIIRAWIHWYNHGQPHQAIAYRSPVQYRAQQATQVA